MKLTKKFLGIAAIIAIIGFSFIACEGLNNDNGSTNGNNSGENSNDDENGDGDDNGNGSENGGDGLKIDEDGLRIDGVYYDEYPLDKGYNAWGKEDYQKGWAIGGIKFEGKDYEIEIADDLGYDIEMFQKATKLMIEMPDYSYPKSRVDIIWGGEDADGDSTVAGGMWNQQQIASGSGSIDVKLFAKKDGKFLIIDLTKTLKDYYIYKMPTTKKLKIILQVNASSSGNVEGLIQKASLLIPITPPPFVGVNDISLTNDTMSFSNELELNGKITPSNASNQSVIWVIRSFSPIGGSSISLPALDPFNSVSVAAYEEAKNELLGGKVGWKQEEYLYYDDTLYNREYRSRDVPIIVVPGGEASVGTVKISALIKQGKKDNNGNLTDFTKEFTITIKDPPPFNFKLAGTPTSTKLYDAVDNKGIASGSKVELTGDGSDTTGYSAYTFTSAGQYGNSFLYFEVQLRPGEKLSDYKGVKCHYTSENCDLTNKSVRLKAMTTKPPKTYNPGTEIATISLDSSVLNGKDTDLIFIFNALNDVKDANKVYIWILPWADSGARFTISDVEFYK
jgi:hypothetical protein